MLQTFLSGQPTPDDETPASQVDLETGEPVDGEEMAAGRSKKLLLFGGLGAVALLAVVGFVLSRSFGSHGRQADPVRPQSYAQPTADDAGQLVQVIIRDKGSNSKLFSIGGLRVSRKHAIVAGLLAAVSVLVYAAVAIMRPKPQPTTIETVTSNNWLLIGGSIVAVIVIGVVLRVFFRSRTPPPPLKVPIKVWMEGSDRTTDLDVTTFQEIFDNCPGLPSDNTKDNFRLFFNNCVVSNPNTNLGNEHADQVFHVAQPKFKVSVATLPEGRLLPVNQVIKYSSGMTLKNLVQAVNNQLNNNAVVMPLTVEGLQSLQVRTSNGQENVELGSGDADVSAIVRNITTELVLTPKGMAPPGENDIKIEYRIGNKQLTIACSPDWTLRNLLDYVCQDKNQPHIRAFQGGESVKLSTSIRDIYQNGLVDLIVPTFDGTGSLADNKGKKISDELYVNWKSQER